VLTTKTGAALIVGAVPFSEGTHMKIEITRAVAIAGKHHDVGEIVEIDDATGRQVIAMDKARVPVVKKGKRSAKND